MIRDATDKKNQLVGLLVVLGVVLYVTAFSIAPNWYLDAVLQEPWSVGLWVMGLLLMGAGIGLSRSSVLQLTGDEDADLWVVQDYHNKKRGG